MHALAVSIPTVAVSTIYCLWYYYQAARLRQARLLQERVLRERVACLLWAAATVPDEPGQAAARRCAPSEPTPLWQPHCPLSLLSPPRKRRRA
jgi:hypothetical protein